MKKQYNNLLKEVEENEFYKEIDLSNRVNCYVCNECHHITKTRDINKGVTPFIHGCEICDKPAISSLYEDIAPWQGVTQEWYRPTYDEFLSLPSSLQDHVLGGGLISRKLTKLKF